MKQREINPPTSWFKTYAAGVFSIPKLSEKEERDLFRRWEEHGDLHARNTIISSNMKCVISIALKYRSSYVNLDDLIAEGNLGLMVAFSKFDGKRGTRFCTYAAFWIKAYILKMIIKGSRQWKTVSWPYRSSVFFMLKREQARCLSMYGECDEATIHLAARLKAPVDLVRDAIKILDAMDVSLDVPVNEIVDTTVKDQIPDWRPTPEDKILAHEKECLACSLVQKAVAFLDGREKYIIEKRYLDDGNASLSEVGRQLGVSRERARQLEQRAKIKIRRCLAKEGVQSFSMV